LGKCDRASKRGSGPTGTILTSPLQSRDAGGRIKQSDHRGHRRRVIPSRANRSPEAGAARDRWPWKAIAPRIAVALLRLGESSRRLNLVIRLQQARFGRFSYHTNLLAGLGRVASG
jgi:hypothetical protein